MSKPKLIERTTNNIGRTFKLIGVDPNERLGRIYLDIFTGLVRAHGKREAVRQLKSLYNESLRFSCGVKFQASTPIWCKRDREGYPIILAPFKRELRGSTIQRRYALSILRAYEAIVLPPIPQLETVTAPSRGKANFAQIRSSFVKFLRESRFFGFIKRIYKEEETKSVRTKIGIPFHFSAKKGVEGPTILTAGKQSLAIDEELKEILKRFNSNFRKGDWVGILEENQRYFKDHHDLHQTTAKCQTYLGRITFIPDKGGKTRTVAIGNYWVQDCLKGLHDTLYNVLRRIPTDGTYDQESQAERVRKQTLVGPVWSYDLTAATDRFPVDPQQLVLEHLNPQMGSDWGEILKRLKFEYEGQVVTYQVGQPMGLYSSWAVFALTHHVLIQYCAWVEKVKYPFNSYAILGDDVAIWDQDVALRYKQMIETLDISISEAKSFTPDDYLDQMTPSAEFAKRVFVSGEEISPISPGIVNESWKVYDLPEFIQFLSDHNFLTESVPVSRVSKLFGLSTKRLSDFCCLLRIKECLGAKLMVNLDKIPSNLQLEKITAEAVIRSRCELLAQQASDLWSRLFDFEDMTGQALEKRLIGPIPDNLYFKRVLSTRLETVIEMENKLVRFLPEEFPVYFDEDLERDQGIELFLAEESVPRPNQDLPKLSEIEYLPKVDVDEVLDLAKQGPQRHRVYRGRYLRNLLAKLFQ